MPNLTITTNTNVPAEALDVILSETTTLLAEKLGKSAAVIQVILDHSRPMQFGGTSEPTAWAELTSLGMDDDTALMLSEVLCDWFSEKLGVPPERTFLAFHDHPRPRFGWNAKTFG